MFMINVMQPSLGDEELDELKKTFKSNWLGKGPKVKEFEQKYADFINSKPSYIISTNCCTEGLFIWPELFGLHAGDEVIIPTISFIGAATSICAHNLKMVLCDVDRRTLNATAETIEKVITTKTKAILLLHFGGIPCEMDEILALVKKYNLILIEDAAPGIWSTYKGQHIGTFGDMGMWSFDAMKILVCGDGAMLHFKDASIRNKAEKLMYFGLETKSGYENSVAQKWWEFDISCFGHRAIMNDITATIALTQLKKLPHYFERRKYVHNYYNNGLFDLKDIIDLPQELPQYSQTSYYFYYIQIKDNTRDNLAKYLRDKGIYTTYRYYPIHRVRGFNTSGSFPNADYAADHTLCLPLHQSLSDADLSFIINSIHDFYKRNFKR